MNFNAIAKQVLTSTALAAALSAGSALAQPSPTEVDYYIPPRADGSVNPDPFLASGFGVGRNVDMYWSAGIGPSGLNTCSAAGTPERFIDYSFYPGFSCGALPAGVTVTEAQGMNNLARIKENLEANGLTLQDVTYLRIYLEAPPGATRADYAGWNRAYRKFFANVNLVTGEVIPAYAPVVVVNATRPARANIQVATLPVLGWLVEIEAVAAYPQGKAPKK
ncbi:MAG: Rid family hydrolase [Burkholderiaceae bacterium]|jgi:enamine deaminase RidA (YjgF/YER057c/UK114 family)|nr:Rid family hydrolase [Burkholderiaceae bacterium]